jgi:hypothetical protein
MVKYATFAARSIMAAVNSVKYPFPDMVDMSDGITPLFQCNGRVAVYCYAVTGATEISGAASIGPEIISNGGFDGSLTGWEMYRAASVGLDPEWPIYQKLSTSGWALHEDNFLVHTPNTNSEVRAILILPPYTGSGYEVDDVLTLDANGDTTCTARVAAIGTEGEILAGGLEILTQGADYVNNEECIPSGGSGTGAVVYSSLAVGWRTTDTFNIDLGAYTIGLTVDGTVGSAFFYFIGMSGPYPVDSPTGGPIDATYTENTGVFLGSYYHLYPSLDFDGRVDDATLKFVPKCFVRIGVNEDPDMFSGTEAVSLPLPPDVIWFGEYSSYTSIDDITHPVLNWLTKQERSFPFRHLYNHTINLSIEGGGELASGAMTVYAMWFPLEDGATVTSLA